MKKIHLIILLSLAINNTNGQWAWIGKDIKDGNVLSLSSNASYLFAGTNGAYGVYYTDMIAPWSPYSSGIPAFESIVCLATNGNNIFAGTNKGVYLSVNGGIWQAVKTGLPDTVVRALAISGSKIFAGTDQGMFLSNNNGTNWTAINSGLTTTYVLSLAISGTNIYAGTNGGGVFLSTNNGSSWAAVNNGLTQKIVYSLAINGSKIFAGTLGYIFTSMTNGASWTLASQPYNAVKAIVVSGSNIYAGMTPGSTGGVALSKNNGQNWMPYNEGFPIPLSSFYVNALTTFAGKIFSSNGTVFMRDSIQVSVEDNGDSDSNSFSVYPNPSIGKFTVSTSKIEANVSIKIFNAMGSIVYQTTLSNQKSEIDLSNKPAGLYFMQVTEGKRHYTNKILIE